MNFNLRIVAKCIIILTGLVLTTPSFAEKIILVAFGDSLSAGYQLPSTDAFPVKLQAALIAKGYDVEVRNAAVSGDTASGGASRLNWSVADDVDGVILELGANDALRGVDPSRTRAAMISMIEMLQVRDIKILLAGMIAPPNMGAKYGNEFNSIYPDVAKAYNVMLYPFFLEGVATIPELNLADGIHPTSKGVDVIVENIMPDVEALIDEIGK